MKKIFLYRITFSVNFLLLVIFCESNSFSQSVADYTFSATAGTYAAISGGSNINLSNYDNGYANNIGIGFNFSYLGTTYNTMNFCADGFLTFGTANIISLMYPINNIATGGKRPLVAPLWDDLLVSNATGDFTYQTNGTSPNRITTVQWNNVKWDKNATNPVISFQVKLYETSNIIQFVYKYVGSYHTGSSGASIGITGASGSYLSVDGLSTSATASTFTATNTIQGPINSSLTGLTYTFTPCSNITIPYNQNFDLNTAPALPPCWSVIDVNSDSYTWKTQTTKSASSPNSLTYIKNSNGTTAADDWAFTPSLVLTGGVTYNISFREATSGSAENLEIKYGNTATVSGMTNAVITYSNLNNTSFTTKTVSVTPASSGPFYFGFHCNSAANKGSLYLDDISFGTLKTWIGSGAGGTGTDFNDGNNWSPAGSPTASDDLIMNINSFPPNNAQANLSAVADALSLTVTFTGNANTKRTFTINTGANNLNVTNTLSLINASTGNGNGSTTTAGHTLSLNVGGGNTTVGKLEILNNGAATANYFLTSVIIASAATLTDNGELNVIINSGANCQVSIGNSGAFNVAGASLAKSLITTGKILFGLNNATSAYTFGGKAVFDDGNSPNGSEINLGGNKTGTMIFSGDVELGTISKSTGSNMIGTITLNGLGNQSVKINSSNISFVKFIAGNANSKLLKVLLSGGSNASLFSSASTSLAVNNGATLDLTNRTLNVSGTKAGSFTIASGAQLSVGSNSGGADLNNFPDNFSTYTFDPASTVEYNGTIDQDITGAVGATNINYGNLILTAGASSNTKTLKAAVTVNGKLTNSDKAVLNLNNFLITVNNGFAGFTGSPNGYIKANQSSDATQASGIIASGTGTLNFDAAYNFLKTFTINSGGNITINNALNMAAGANDDYGTLTVDGDFYTNGYLTLKSDGNGTARVATSLGHIHGDATVERFLKSKRAWRELAVPFASSNQTIRDAWQEGVNNTTLSTNLNPNPGFGTHITYNDPAMGFDLNTKNNPSLLYYIQSNGDFSYVAPPTISTNICAYNAYLIFIRGSRAVDLNLGTSAPSDNTVLRIKGVLNEGKVDKSYINTTPSDNLLVANPFASSIDLTNVFTNSVGILTTQYSVWDPFLSGTYGLGAYRTYANSLFVPFDENNPSANTPVIQSGQSLFLTANGNSSIVSIRETDKTANENVVQLIGNTLPRLYVNLKIPSGDSSITIGGIGAVFDTTFSKYIDSNDARKIYSSSVQTQPEITIIRRDTNLAVEAYPYPITAKDTMFIRLYNLATQTYFLKFIPQYMPQIQPSMKLIDSYLNTSTTLSLTASTTYSFSAMQGDTNTFKNRFKIVLKFDSSMFGRPQQHNLTALNLKEQSGISIYPNPVTSGLVNIKFNDLETDKYEIQFVNAFGTVLMKKKIDHKGGSFSYDFAISKNWPNGKYQVLIKGHAKEYSVPFIINKL